MGLVRIVLAVIAGVALGFGVVVVGEIINHRLWPPQDELQITNPDAVRAYLETAPLPALIGLPLFWTIAAFVASFASAKIGGRLAGWIAGAIVFAATCLNLAFIPHPLWMLIASVVCVPAAAWFGARLAAPKAAA